MHTLLKVLKILVAVPLFFVVPGFLLFRSRLSSGLNLTGVEKLCLIIAVSTGTTSIIALLLGELGFLNLGVLVGLLALVSAAIALLWGVNRRRSPRGDIRYLEIAVVIAMAVLAIVLFFHPSEWVTGDSDPGVYYNTGSHLARYDSITIVNEEIPEFTAEEAPLLLPDGRQFIGFHIKDMTTGEIPPAFYHLLPVWIGLFIKLFGVSGGLYVNCVFAVLAVLLMYCIGRRLGGLPAGLSAGGLMCLCSLEIWFARIPAAEILAQYFLLATLLVLVLHLRHPHRLYAPLLGLSFTCALLVKVETLLILFPLLFFFLVRMILGEYDRRDRWLVNAALAGTLLSLVYAMLFKQGYFLNAIAQATHWEFVIMHGRVPIYVAMAALVLPALLFNLDIVNRALDSLGRSLKRASQRLPLQKVHWIRLAGALTALAFFIYLWVSIGSKPDMRSPSTNFLRFSWMTGWLFLLIGVAGFCFLLYQSGPALSAFLFSGMLMVSYFFFLKYSGRFLLPWDARRYLPTVMPLLFLGAGFLIGFLWHRRLLLLKLVPVCLAALVLLSLLPTTKVVMKDTRYAGSIEQIRQMAAAIPDATVFMPNKLQANILGIPLRYQEEKDIYWLSSEAKKQPQVVSGVIRRFAAEGRGNLFACLPDALYHYTPWIEFKDTGFQFEFTFRDLKKMNAKPSGWGTGELPLHYYEASAAVPESPEPGWKVSLSPSEPWYFKDLVMLDNQYYIAGVKPESWAGVAALDQNALNELLASGEIDPSRAKIPVGPGPYPMSVTIIASHGGLSGGSLVICANGRPVRPDVSDTEGHTSFSFVIAPEEQQENFQELLLLAPATGWTGPVEGVAPSEVRLVRVDAELPTARARTAAR